MFVESQSQRSKHKLTLHGRANAFKQPGNAFCFHNVRHGTPHALRSALGYIDLHSHFSSINGQSKKLDANWKPLRAWQKQTARLLTSAVQAAAPPQAKALTFFNVDPSILR